MIYISKRAKKQMPYLVLMGVLLSGASVVSISEAQAAQPTCRKGGTVVPDADCQRFASQIAPASCTPLNCSSNSDDDDNGSDSDDDDVETGGGYVDTDGDGKGDTHISDYDGEYDGPTSSSPGGSMDGHSTKESKTALNGDDFYEYDGDHEGGDSGTSDDDDGGDSVLCTYFYQRGELDEMLYFADIECARRHINPVAVRGYHAWSIAYVRHLRQNPGGLLEKIIRPVVLHRAREIGYQMGVRDKPDYIGKLMRWTLEPLCFGIGLFAEEKDWRTLYSASDFHAFTEGYKRYRAFRASLA